MFDLHLPTLSVVVGSASIDSINPCAIGVLILMISVVLGGKGSLKRLLLLGSLYIFAIFLTYLIAGLGLIYFLSKVPIWVSEYLSITVGSIVILAGILEIKDFYWYGKGFSLKSLHTSLIKFMHFPKIYRYLELFYWEALLWV